MSELTEIFQDTGFEVDQIVASNYLTKRILTFKVAAVGKVSAETHDLDQWKASYPDIQVGDVVLSLSFTDEPERIMHVAPKYHQVVPFPAAAIAA